MRFNSITTLRNRLPEVRGRARISLLTGILLVLILLPFSLGQYTIHILTMSLFFGFMGIAWNIIGGYSGQFSIGHSVFLGIGGYASTLLYLRLGLNPWLAMFAGAVITGIIGLVIGYFLLRLPGAFFPMASIAFLMVVKLLVTYFRNFTRGSQGISLPMRGGVRYLAMSDKTGYFYIILALLIIGIVLSYRIRRSKLGLDLLALRDDHDAAEALGVATHSAKIKAMGISAVLTSLAGSFFAHYTSYIDPETIFSVNYSFQMPLVSILGGLGTPVGPIIGSVIMVPVDSFLRANLSGRLAGLNLVVYGLVLMTAVRFFPDGIFSLFQKKEGKSRRFQEQSETTGSLPGAPENHTSFEGDHKRLAGKAESDTILEVANLTVCFGGLTAVKDFGVRIGSGEIIGLIGPNGAGKTTCFNAITGYITKSRAAGKVAFLGQEIKPKTPPHRLCRLGITRTFQIVKPFKKMTVLENVMVAVMMYAKNYQKAKQAALAYLEQCGLAAYAEAHPGSLTIANQKKLELARALATRPKILMLDEPMAGLNPAEMEDMIRTLREITAQGMTMVIIEHIMKAIMSLCDRIVVLDHGEKIAEGIPAEVANNERVINAYLGERYDA